MPSKDQATIEDNETKDQKWNRGLDLFIESLHKPDHELRGCAHNQRCFVELMEVRDNIVEYTKTLRR
jgi:hypothetical protein